MHIKGIRSTFGRLSLSVRIIAGLGLGVFTGLFFGEPAAVLQPVADIYIRLMQMTVLPYLVLSLIIGFGQLEADQARRLALRAGLMLLIVWALTFAVLVTITRAQERIELHIDEATRRRGCTCIVVAHRLSTIRDSDEIIVMEKGKIIQRGTHDEMKDADGPYARLIKE